MPIQHILFDADGVLQLIPGGWYTAMETYLGDRSREFLHATWDKGSSTLSGQGDYLPILADALAEYGVAASAEQVFRDVWLAIEIVEPSIALVRDLRAQGYGVHLGTNQEHLRAAHMRSALGYDELFDTSSYSCEVGAAKPSPDFFRGALRAINAEPSTVLFIDDFAPNVEGARAVGLAAEQWEVGQGHEVLLTHLETHGIAARRID